MLQDGNRGVYAGSSLLSIDAAISSEGMFLALSAVITAQIFVYPLPIAVAAYSLHYPPSSRASQPISSYSIEMIRGV